MTPLSNNLYAMEFRVAAEIREFEHKYNLRMLTLFLLMLHPDSTMNA